MAEQTSLSEVVSNGADNSLLKDYVRAVYANKFTLAGYVAVATSQGMRVAGVSDNLENFVCAAGVGLLMGSNFGALACHYLRRTRREIAECQDSPYYSDARFYCSAVGAKMAMEDANLPVSERIAQRSRIAFGMQDGSSLALGAFFSAVSYSVLR